MTKQEALKRHKELNNLARKAQEAYYNGQDTIMEDREYDRIFDEIKSIEDQYDYHPADSIIQTAGISGGKGKKVTHKFNCLSQDKTKDRNELKKWLKDKEGVLSEKCDGNTLVLTYKNGNLVLGATRGDGHIGDDITNIVKVLNCIPKTISDKGDVIVRGEYLITYKDFERINDNLPAGVSKYKNPRNLASGTLNQDDLNIVKQRQGDFHVFELVTCTGFDHLDKYEAQLTYCEHLGFHTVERKLVNPNNILDAIEEFEKKIPSLGYPTDGLVLRFNDDRYGQMLGYTGHAPKFSIAFKWNDDITYTKLLGIDWQCSKTGRINPVAVFEEIEIGGAKITRANLNNISYIKQYLGKPYVGQKIGVIRANQVIPNIVWGDKE